MDKKWYENSEIDTNVFQEHSTRYASASVATLIVQSFYRHYSDQSWMVIGQIICPIPQ